MKPMRVLLIAYEFSPSPSPQSLRWTYLGRELVRAGHEVHVVTTEPAWAMDGLPALPPQMHIHRVVGGPIAAALAMLVRRQQTKRAARGGGASRSGHPISVAGGPTAPLSPVPGDGARLNWKGRLVERLKPVAMNLLYPDVRGEWAYPARKEVERLLEAIRPDIMITSHEPAMPLEVGIRIKRRHRIPWLADLGDPVLADYTPRRWHRRAFRVERQVMRLADGITVTAPGTRQLLLERHRAASGKGGIQVLAQGFDDAVVPDAGIAADIFDDGLLELLYTGSFYQFRRPDALIDAILVVAGVRLNVAASAIPDWLRSRFDAHPERFRLLGFRPHLEVLALQRRADVLVNVANDNPCQVPGKIYEYLGAGRPILHTGNIVEEDVSAELVRDRRRGWICAGGPEIESLLRTLVAGKRAGQPDPAGLDLGPGAVVDFSWRQRTRQLVAILGRLAHGRDISPGVAATNEGTD